MSNYPNMPAALADNTDLNRFNGPRPFPMLAKKPSQEGLVVVKPEPIVPSLSQPVAPTMAMRIKDEPKEERHIQPIPLDPPHTEQDDAAAVQGEPYSSEAAFKAIKRHITHLSAVLTDSSLNLPDSRLKQRKAELAKLKEACGARTAIAVVRATGAGNSSVINALLDQGDLVPTNCMRACTAVVTEISYHNKTQIEADIEFLSKEDWKTELRLLLDDLANDDGAVRRSSDLRSEAGIAFAKFTAVYPPINLDDISDYTVDDLLENGVVPKLLGKTEHVSSATGTRTSPRRCRSGWTPRRRTRRRTRSRTERRRSRSTGLLSRLSAFA